MNRQQELRLWDGFLLLLLLIPYPSIAMEQRHLIGFVERLCTDTTDCFIIRVEPEYRQVADEQLVVWFDSRTRFY